MSFNGVWVIETERLGVALCGTNGVTSLTQLTRGVQRTRIARDVLGMFNVVNVGNRITLFVEGCEVEIERIAFLEAAIKRPKGSRDVVLRLVVIALTSVVDEIGLFKFTAQREAIMKVIAEGF